MLSRLGRVALLVFQAVWFNIILPGHARGIVTVPGCPACQQESTCPFCHVTTKPKKAPADPRDHDKRAANCAICAFAARVTVEVPPDLRPPPLRLVGIAAAPLAQVAPQLSLLPTYDGRAPPAA